MSADYGTDLSCTSDLTPTMRTVSGAGLMREVCYRRLTTAPGSLLSAPNAETIDVRDFVGATISSGSTSYFGAQISRALESDQRVLSASVISEISGEEITSQVKVMLADGEFKLVLGISAVSVEILQA